MKKCEFCGAEFTAHRLAKYCSDKCRNAAWKRRNDAALAERKGEGPRVSARRVFDADGRHRKFRERQMRAEPWRYEFAPPPESI